VFTLSAQQTVVASTAATIAAEVATDVSLLGSRFNLYLTQVSGTWTAYTESRGNLYPAKRSIEKPNGSPGQQPTFRRGSVCWWLSLIFTGIEVCE
jgi:hypothetical protein